MDNTGRGRLPRKEKNQVKKELKKRKKPNKKKINQKKRNKSEKKQSKDKGEANNYLQGMIGGTADGNREATEARDNLPLDFFTQKSATALVSIGMLRQFLHTVSNTSSSMGPARTINFQ